MKRNQKAKGSQTTKKKNKKKISFPKEPENQKLDLRLLEDVKNLSTNKKVKLAHKLIDERKKNPNYKLKRISKNTAYKRGRAFEYRVKKHFEKLGYYVVRKYASKGAEDLIAIRGVDLRHNPITLSETLFIQCKNLKVEKKLKREDAERLIKLAKQCGGTPLLAFNRNHKLNITQVE